MAFCFFFFLSLSTHKNGKKKKASTVIKIKIITVNEDCSNASCHNETILYIIDIKVRIEWKKNITIIMVQNKYTKKRIFIITTHYIGEPLPPEPQRKRKGKRDTNEKVPDVLEDEVILFVCFFHGQKVTQVDSWI